MKSRRLQVPLLGVGILSGSVVPCVRAQATQTADQRIRLTAFSLGSYVRPDYGASQTNAGVTFGGEVDGFRLLPHTDIGMDIRYTASHGSISNQSVFAGGPRISLSAFRFQPYLDYLVGLGHSDFNNPSDPNYTSDRTRTRGYGLGFDYRVTRFWSLRADAQRQRWRFSVHTAPFYPEEISVGLAYQVHFHSRYGPQ